MWKPKPPLYSTTYIYISYAYRYTNTTTAAVESINISIFANCDLCVCAFLSSLDENLRRCRFLERTRRKMYQPVFFWLLLLYLDAPGQQQCYIFTSRSIVYSIICFLYKQDVNVLFSLRTRIRFSRRGYIYYIEYLTTNRSCVTSAAVFLLIIDTKKNGLQLPWSLPCIRLSKTIRT